MIQTVLGVFLILLHIVCCVLVWLGIDTSAEGEKISDGTCDLRPFLGNSVRAAFAFANADQKRQ